MARKAQEILKAQGYTDQDIAGLDPRFLRVLEQEDLQRDQIAAEQARLQGVLDNTNRWFNEEANPMINQYQGEIVNSRTRIAQLEAQLKAEQDLGMRRVATGGQGSGSGSGQGQGAGAGAGGGQPGGAGSGAPDFAPYDQRYVSTDVFRQAFDQTGEAIAIMNDISEDYRDLFGKRMPGGAAGLRQAYSNATRTGGFRGNIREFAESHFKMGDKRTEIEAKEREKHEASVGQAAVQRYIEQHGLTGNPMTRMPTASRNPFVAKPAVENGTTDGRQPWERGTVEARRSERVQKHGTKFLQGAA